MEGSGNLNPPNHYFSILMMDHLKIDTYQDEQDHFREIKELIKKYDDDHSGNLNAQELKKCIEVYSNARHWTTDPVTPTEEEIALLMKAAGCLKQNSIDAAETRNAIDLWHSYVTNRKKIHAAFEKYDTDHNQQLEFDQLVCYLTDLNEGHKPEVSMPPVAEHRKPSPFLMSRLRAGCRGQGADAADERRRRGQQSAAHPLHLPLASRPPPPARFPCHPPRNSASPVSVGIHRAGKKCIAIVR